MGKNVSKKNSRYLLLYIIPLLFFLSALALHFFDVSLQSQIQQIKLIPLPLPKTIIDDYPTPNRPIIDPFISAQAAYVIDDTAKVLLYTKNADLRLPMASTTKVMTALVAREHFKDTDVLNIQRGGVEGTIVGFYPGEQLTFHDLLYAMLLPSGNDAALAIADNYPGGVEAFVSQMNKKAQEIHLDNTHYTDPDGLDDDGDFTTASDLARLSSVALEDSTLAQAFGTEQATITSLSGQSYSLFSTNKLLGYQGVMGVKTGETSGAGGVLISAKTEKGHTFIIVVMHSEDRFFDTRTLLSYVTDNITLFRPTFITRSVLGKQ